MRIFPALILAAALTTAGAATAQSNTSAQNDPARITNGPNIENVSADHAIIAWSTNGGTNSVIHYGTDPNNLSQTASGDFAQSGGSHHPHRVRINGLQPGTTYYFRVDSDQTQGNDSNGESQVQSFTTKGNNANGTQAAGYNNQAVYNGHAGQGSPDDYGAVRIVSGPNLEGVGRDSAVIAWSTNTGASSVVHYGTDPNNLNQTAQGPYADQVGTHNNPHRVQIKGLQPNTHYYYRVDSGQGQRTGTEAQGQILEFTTKQ